MIRPAPHPVPRRDPRAGFSTINAIISLVLLSLILAPIVGTVIAGQERFVEGVDRSRTDGGARYAHLALTRLIRAAGSHPTGSPVDGIDPDPLADGVFDDIRIRADYNPADGDTDDPGEDNAFFVRGDTMFVSVNGGDEEPYILGVDSLAFTYFDIEGVEITDPDRVRRRAVTARITIRARGEVPGSNAEQLITGLVRIRNGR